jgi:hypothetical protein
MGNVLASPFYAAFLTLLILVVGVIGGIYPDDIKKAFPFTLLTPTDARACFPPDAADALRSSSNVHVVAVFWAGSFVSALMFFLREAATEKRRQSAADKLERLIRTMPPEEFLSLFREFYVLCRTTEIAVQNGNRAVIEEGIRVILFGIISLVRAFERNTPKARYAANVMIFVPQRNFAKLGNRLTSLIRFLPAGNDVDKLDGVLLLQPQLSTTISSAKSDPDGELSAFALPVPAGPPQTAEERWRALPGAPLAWMRRKAGGEGIDGYENTMELRNIEPSFDLPHSTIVDVAHYFDGVAQSIRSFQSVAISEPGSDPIAVLNLHSDHPGLLSEKKPAEQFFALIVPFVSILVRVLSAWQNSLQENENELIPEP